MLGATPVPIAATARQSTPDTTLVVRQRKAMTSRILIDAAARPDLFFWNGPISDSVLHAWLAQQKYVLPDDLFAFLAATGGGDAFETETFLGPYGHADLGDDLVGANQALRSEGMPEGLLAFHRGLVVSALELKSSAYITLESRRFTPELRFGSFEEWYAGTLRSWYGKRYGLPNVAA